MILSNSVIRFFKFNPTKIICFAVIIASYIMTTCTATVLYEGYQVWRITPRNDADVMFIKQLGDANDISVWSMSPTRVDFLIDADNRVRVHRLLQQKHMNHTVLIMDVQRRIESSLSPPAEWSQESLRLGHRMNWKSYPTLTNIEEYYEYLTENYPSICKVLSVGVSAENRTIKMVSISNGNPSNEHIVITGGQHAREWVSITSAFYIINDIVSNFDTQPAFIKNKDWHVIPLVNPDGYEYTRKTDRLWRKNRRRQRHCYGVDLNRNYDSDWNRGTDNNECTETYAGPHAFSEPETVAIRDALTLIRTLKMPSAYVDIHSYGQLVIYPWSYTTHSAPNLERLKSTAEKMVQAIFNATKQTYRPGTATQLIYPVSGAALDWVYNYGVELSFAIETRDKGVYGFLMPANLITATGRDLMQAMKQIAIALDPVISSRKHAFHSWF